MDSLYCDSNFKAAARGSTKDSSFAWSITYAPAVIWEPWQSTSSEHRKSECSVERKSWSAQLENGAHRVHSVCGFRTLLCLKQVPLLLGYSKVRLLSRRFSHALPGKVATRSHGSEQTLQRQSGSGLTFSRLSLICVGFGLHLCLQVSGWIAACGTVTLTLSTHTLEVLQCHIWLILAGVAPHHLPA